MIHRLDSTPSTQDVLHELAASGASAGTTVVAREQTLGRGSRGRSWQSPAGGLWMSVLLRPTEVPALEVLSLRVALAAAGVLESAGTGILVGLKWPNDLLLAGRKLGGVLCEARWHGATLGWVAVGLGVNVANPIPDALKASAISLGSVVPGALPEPLVAEAAAALMAAGELRGHLTAEELERFRARDWLAGKRLREPATGTADGVAKDGALILRRDDGSVVELRSGTVLLAAG
jgi:BirA family biotin operon repressor/biotin-[acetyl-CoA-carboxylase] ligase